MLHSMLSEKYASLLAFGGILFAFALTVCATGKFGAYLPKDAGRDFAVQGKLSAGKPRGAGILFVSSFAAAGLLFAPLRAEYGIYLLLIILSMLAGFFDDASKTPWGEYRKGFLDLCIAVVTAYAFLKYNSGAVELALFHVEFTLHPMVFGLLAVVLVWTSVNVTNCADGVDGLSGTLTIITIMTIYAIFRMPGRQDDFSVWILLFAVCILGYLWYNATPSRLMMGDAGSRAMGLFISIAILKTGCPFLYIPVAFVLIMDGGLGLAKVSLLRFCKIRILQNVRTPLHDHVRKVWDWSNTQTVYRFAIIQIMIAAAALYGMQI